MQHAVIVSLIEHAVQAGDTAWADLGSGDGAFTSVLRELLGAEAQIYSVDADAARLRHQRKSWQGVSGAAAGASATQIATTTRTQFIKADFTQPLDLPPLDGILLANALHFVPSDAQAAFLRRLRTYLKPAGRLLIVEYDMHRSSMWVPYPVPLDRLTSLVSTTNTADAAHADANANAGANADADAGYKQPVLLSTAPSRYHDGQIYSALIKI